MFILFLPGTNHLLPPACENWPVVENLPKIHMQNDLVKLANASSSRRVIPCHSPTRWKITSFQLGGYPVQCCFLWGVYSRQFFRAWWYRYLNIMISDGSPSIQSPLKKMVQYFVVAVFFYIAGDVSVIAAIQGITSVTILSYAHPQSLTWAP